MRFRPSLLASIALTLAGLPACSGGEDGKTGQVASAESCNLHTQYQGDANCILPPDPSEGFQIHVGPTNYDDPNDVATYLLQPDANNGKGESVECYHLVAPNDHAMYNRQRKYRMRPGSHHLILKNGDGNTGWGPCPDALQTAWGGSQRQISDVAFGEIAPEDADFASHIDAYRQAAVELHYFTQGEPVLREAWINFYEADPNHQWKQLNGIALIGLNGLNVAPHTTRDLSWTATNNVQGRRVVYVQGHVHSHTTQMTVTRTSASGQTRIYQLDDWQEPLGIHLNTVTQNPAPGATTATESGVSGLLYLDAGDTLTWSCHVVNDLSTSLVFANEALTAEMCIMFGSTPEATWQAIPPLNP